MAEFDRIARAATLWRARARVAVLVAVLSVVALGCSDDDSATPSSSTTSDAASPTSTPEATSTPPDATSTTPEPTSTPPPAPSSEQSVEEDVIARYIAYWDARFTANSDTPNPDDPALREYATGDQLETVIDETRQRRDDGLSLRQPEQSRTDHTVAVVSSTADRAELQDCFVNDGVVYRVATGEVIDDSVVTRNVLAVMVLVDGVWKLERATVIQEWEGIAGCAPGG